MQECEEVGLGVQQYDLPSFLFLPESFGGHCKRGTGQDGSFRRGAREAKWLSKDNIRRCPKVRDLTRSGKALSL